MVISVNRRLFRYFGSYSGISVIPVTFRVKINLLLYFVVNFMIITVIFGIFHGYFGKSSVIPVFW